MSRFISILTSLVFCLSFSATAWAYLETQTITAGSTIPDGWAPTGSNSIVNTLTITNLNGAPYGASKNLLFSYTYPNGSHVQFSPPAGWSPRSENSIANTLEFVNLNGAPYGATFVLHTTYAWPWGGGFDAYHPPSGWVFVYGAGGGTDEYRILNLNGAPYRATSEYLSVIYYSRGGGTQYIPPSGWVTVYGAAGTDAVRLLNLNGAPHGATAEYLSVIYYSHGGGRTFSPPVGWIITTAPSPFNTYTIYNTNELTPDANSILSNLSSRGLVGSGENVLIGGFVIGGSGSKNILVNGRGPTLATYGVANCITDPTINLNGSPGQIGTNDDWQSASNASQIANTGLAPANNKEAAILQNLGTGAYSVVMNNFGSGSIGIFELFDLPGGTNPKLVNISTRAFVGTGDGVLISGFIITGGNKRVLINGKGPSLGLAGIGNPLSNPKLSLNNSSGAQIASNDNWQNAWNAAAINNLSYKPTNANEASIDEVLPAGTYTVVLTGVSSGTGVGLIEIYDL